MTIHFNHAEHTLERLEGFLHDAISEENISAEKIYDTIIENVAENVEYHQIHYQKSKRLFNLLKGYEKLNTETQENVEENTYDDMVDEDVPMFSESEKEDKIIKWLLPVEKEADGEYYIILPEDLLNAAKLTPGDNVEWVELTKNSYLIRKVEES
jgi:antitoxin component of MazEF toxin-antitoxin module